MKEKRKELAAIFFCTAFTTVLAACGGKNEGQAGSGNPAAQTEASSEASERGNGQELSFS